MVSRRVCSRLAVLAQRALGAALLLSAGCGEGALGPPERVAAAGSKVIDPSREWVETQKLLSNDALPYTYFGSAISLDGDTALIGAYRADHDRGAAYVFIKNGDKWMQQARLTTDDGAQGDLLGSSVALAGDRAVIGASFATGNTQYSGAAYVFERSAGKWLQTKKLVVEEAFPGSGFGYSVAISGDTIVVGSAQQADVGQWLEAAYVFAWDGADWKLSQRLLVDDGQVREFGLSVALDKGSLVVGAPSDDQKIELAGAAYVYGWSGAAWELKQKLIGEQTKSNSRFGSAVALFGGTLLAGAPFHSVTALQSGAAYVFARDPAGVWQQQAELTANETPKKYNRFGGAVALSEDTAVVGRFYTYNMADPGITFTDKGSAYVFTRDGDAWPPVARLEARDSFPGNLFGQALGVKGDTLFVGASEVDTPTADDPGATYVLSLRSIQGSACEAGNQCESGFCADGVCCDSACDSPCQACSARNKGGGEDGACGPVPDGSHPDDACGRYTCSAGACLTSCQAAQDCVESYYCNPDANRCEQLDIEIGDRGGCNCRTPPGASRGASPWPVALVLAGLFCAARRGLRRSSLRTRRSLPVGAGALLVTLAASPDVAAEPVQFQEQAELYAGDEKEADQFGYAIAASGDTVVVGAPFQDAGRPSVSNAGAAYVFVRTADTWKMQAKLVAEQPEQDAYFGASVALEGDTVVVGAPAADVFGGDAGAAYVFVRAGEQWTLQKTLTPSGARQPEQFGSSVAVSGDTLVVGAPLFDEGALVNVGEAYLFERRGGQWEEVQKLTSPSDADKTTSEDDRFGAGLAISGDTLVVGAPNEDLGAPDSGAAHLYTRENGAWRLEATLHAEDGKASDSLGEKIALEGDTLVLGVPLASGQKGAVYVAQRGEDRAFGALTKLTPRDGAIGDAFGSSVALLGDAMLVGAPLRDVMGEDSGAAYVFWRRSEGWLEQTQVNVQDELGGDHFGATVALLERVALVGAPLNDVLAKASGGLYSLLLGTPARCLDTTHSVAARLPDDPAEAVIEGCSPHRCEPVSGQCQRGCVETSQCAPGFFCDPTQDACMPPPAADLGPRGGCSAAAALSPEAAKAALGWLCAGLLLARRRAGRLRG